MPSYPGFLGPAYASASYMADSEVLLNWFLEKNESPTAPQPWVMLPTPGFDLFTSVDNSPVRGMFYQRGRAFFVAGFAFRELLADGTTVLKGTVENDANPVTINANGDAGNQLWITSGGVGYIYDLETDDFSPEGPTDAVVSMGGFLSGRFLALDSSTGAFYASDLYDGTTWDPLMVAQSQSGDPWRALIVTPDKLIRLLGESTGECWADSGAFPFPFTVIQESGIPFGIVAPFAWSVDTTVSWLAQNANGRGIVVRAQGYQPARISTHAIEYAIGRYADLSDVTAFSYQENGHQFVLFTFPSDEATWVYDITSSLWHQRDFWNTTTGESEAYRPGCMMEAFGKILVGDRLTGDIFQMSSSFQYDFYGKAIRRVRQPPRFSIDQKRLTVTNLQLVMDVGRGVPGLATTVEDNGAWGDAWGMSWGDAWGDSVTTTADVGVDPQMMLQVSRDGGKTFPLERWTSAGAQGEWNTRVIWTQLGQARNFTPRFVATDPVPWPITDCLIDYREGTS